MKKYILYLILSCSYICAAQNVVVDSQTYSPQQLIEDILIDSDCITNVQITNVVGGDFGGSDQSYGFFDASGTTFPFQSGIVMSTGRLQNVQGPNTFLSDDDAPGWSGDNDLEVILNESNTINATILEFDFTALASQVSFRYIFASEEYQEGNPNTCQFSDLFGFLIRPVNETQYTNIALVPDTPTPVKVTTVHPDIPAGCEAENEFYFESFNDTTAPINFNGQTKVLTAIADIIPNETYHVKLVIADEQNFRYDSAVFLEAGGFQLATDLGPDRLLSNNTALCEGETLLLNALVPNGPHVYSWFKDGVLVETSPPNCLNCSLFTVSEPGIYSVEVDVQGNCIAYGDVVIEYAENPVVVDSNFIQCDIDMDGLTTYNLTSTVLDIAITNGDSTLFIIDFFLAEEDAEHYNTPISDPESFQNTVPNQMVYARVENQNGCYAIAEVSLEISNVSLSVPPVEVCDDEIVDGITTFSLLDVRNQIETLVPDDTLISFYATEEDALNNGTQLGNTIQNFEPFSDTIYAYVFNDNGCYVLFPIELNVLYTPQLLPDEEVYYCLNSFPETIEIQGGVLNDSPSNYYYEWLFNGATTEVNTSFNIINEAGTYTVIVTDPNGCSSQRDITVVASDTATIVTIGIEQNNLGTIVTVNISGDGNYEYALDNPDTTYQDSNSFTEVSSGFHTVYVRDTNGCGVVETLFSVLGFPKYFTPNDDTFNDRWKPKGVNGDFNSGMKIKIFDRYGKLLSEQTSESQGWDGTLQGNPMPSTDYWFLATLADGRMVRGHFALRR
ncbi:choice-of-anchor L domain-containing protein [Ichthyenterobacterium sp. W332]|uniref:Choice-of-anchor L domain-containing protein n=1 Tax=Microcosmobacter mediterraneus TaxID=3075607 RepID=A0ABU2YH02_9FLAO|nr:choice-of-anchor L domain-containing protein [Ichthyenterobacterium sp. W332]MDT0557072.1 choice-of-anchor L domain-containing protein [Ichthyenterobacterium sp. W332]